MSNYSLLQEDIFRRLREGHGEVDGDEWFYEAISSAARTIAESCNAVVELSPRRLTEAHDDWDNDLSALIRDKRIEGTTTNPCHVKHSAFLCYWLRRRVVINKITAKKGGISDDLFKNFPNEYFAARLTMLLLFYTEFCRKVEDKNAFLSWIKENPFPYELLQDLVIMLRYKNVSPHGLYLVFKALVTPINPKGGGPRAVG